MSNATPGGNLVGIGASVGMWLASAVMAAVALVLGVGTIMLDLWLGPQFMGAYAEQHGSPAFWMTKVIPWSFSVATTGFQYMLYRGYQHGRSFKSSNASGKFAFASGWFVAILDTTTDVAGLTSWMYGPEVGVHVFPSDTPTAWVILALGVMVLCGCQEFLLVPLLKNGSKSLSGLSGSILVEGAVTLVGWTFNILRMVALAFAVASILVLDITLTWYFVRVQLLENGGMQEGVASWLISAFISIAITGVQVLLFRRKRMGDLGRSLWVLVAFGLTILDTLSDIGGFTTLMYGPGEGMNIIPANAPYAWWLIALTIVGLCYSYEYMMATMMDADDGGFSARSGSKAAAITGDPFAGMPPMPSGPPPGGGLEDLLKKM